MGEFRLWLFSTPRERMLRRLARQKRTAVERRRHLSINTAVTNSTPHRRLG
jgi:hypothetical protein